MSPDLYPGSCLPDLINCSHILIVKACEQLRHMLKTPEFLKDNICFLQKSNPDFLSPELSEAEMSAEALCCVV